MPKNILTLTSSEAIAMVNAVVEAADKAGDGNISVAVVDAAGHVLALRRMDKAGVMTGPIAEKKARTAAVFQRSTISALEELNDPEQNMGHGRQIGVSLMTIDGLMLLPGGLPIYYDDVCVGAIAASGGVEDSDNELCIAGVETVSGFTAKK